MTTLRVIDFGSIEPGDRIVLTRPEEQPKQHRVLVVRVENGAPETVRYAVNYTGSFTPRVIVGADGTEYRDHAVTTYSSGLQGTDPLWTGVQLFLEDDAEGLRQDIRELGRVPGVDDNPRPFLDSIHRVIAAAASTLPDAGD